MSVTVQKINDDSSFLLHFNADSDIRDGQPFTILVDPWLIGASSMLHPSFQLAKLQTKPIIASLAHLDPVPIILVTQDKADHCHQETLCSLPPDTPTIILATAAAAKKIRKWNHFRRPERIITIPTFDPKRPDHIITIPIPGATIADTPGQLSLVNVSSKLDLAGLHNAICIRYCPPRSTFGGVKEVVPNNVLSVVYTPHGIAPETLQPYLRAWPDALPTTLLFHCFTLERNPTLLGGVTNNGAVGGLQIAQALNVKHWIGAHDEVKDSSGFVVKWLKTTPFALEDVRQMLAEVGSSTEACTLDCGASRTFMP